MKEFEIFKLEDRVLFEAAAAAEIVAAADAASQVLDPEPEPQDSLAAALNGGPAGGSAGADPAAQKTPAGIDGELDALINGIALFSARTLGSPAPVTVSVTDFNGLQTALEDAAANGGNYVITIENDITVTDDLYIYADNDLNLTIQGAENIQDANGVADLTAGDNLIFHFDDSLDEYTINITISNLNFNGQSAADTAISTYGVENLEITGARIENFTESAVIQEYGSLTVTDSEFIGNKSLNDSGSAIRALDAEVSISGSYFAGNESEVDDGVLWIENAPSLTITDTTFANNNGTAAHLTDNTTVTIDNTTFYGNTGGALHLFGDQQVAITNSTFAANSADSDGSAVYNNGGTVNISNTLLIGDAADNSVVFQDGSGSTDLVHSLATSVAGDGTVNGATADWVSSDYDFANVFGQNIYSETTRTIAPDAFHKAAWSGMQVGSTNDQLGNDRNIINATTGLSGLYTIGAVNAQVGLIVTQGDAEVNYTGNVITPEAILTLTYANGDMVSKAFTADLKSTPSPVKEVGVYTITPENASVEGVNDAVFLYKGGTLTVKGVPSSPYHVYCEGLYPGHFSTVITMQTELLLQSFGQAGYGNFYTMSYPELVYHTMEVRSSAFGIPGGDMAYTVTVDPLKYCPVSLDEPALELSESLSRNSSLTNTSAFYTGSELFEESGDDALVQIFRNRGETLSPDHEPLVIDDAADDSQELCLADDQQGQKVSSLKGAVERLLDELCQA